MRLTHVADCVYYCISVVTDTDDNTPTKYLKHHTIFTSLFYVGGDLLTEEITAEQLANSEYAQEFIREPEYCGVRSVSKNPQMNGAGDVAFL